MVDANIWDIDYQQIAKQLYESCEICQKFHKTPARPVVSLPLATKFNEAVAMDLKIWSQGVNILYLIDMFTKFTTARIIKDKKPSTIIDNVMQMWIGNGFGTPAKFLADNGGEFANVEFKDMCENLNIEVLHTAAESPCQNGLCERNHAVVDRCLEKIVEENSVYCLQMWNGFSSYQLVFGQNPNLPNVMVDQLPAFEGTTNSDVFAAHINALQSARRAYIEDESSSKVRKALKHKVRASSTKFSTGEKVFYKRDESNKWKGPGKVIGQDGKIVFVRHGNVYVRVSTNRLIKMGQEFRNPLTETDLYNLQSKESRQHTIESDESDEADEPKTLVTSSSHSLTNSQEVDESSSEHSTHQIQPSQQRKEAPLSSEERPVQINQQNQAATQPLEKRLSLPKKRDVIKYCGTGAEKWKEATGVGRAGKATGKFSSWLNLTSKEDDEPICLDFNTVEEWSKIDSSATKEHAIDRNEPEETVYFTVPVEEHQSNDVNDAKKQEIQNWKTFKVFEKVENNGQRRLLIQRG